MRHFSICGISREGLNSDIKKSFMNFPAIFPMISESTSINSDMLIREPTRETRGEGGRGRGEGAGYKYWQHSLYGYHRILLRFVIEWLSKCAMTRGKKVDWDRITDGWGYSSRDPPFFTIPKLQYNLCNVYSNFHFGDKNFFIRSD